MATTTRLAELMSLLKDGTLQKALQWQPTADETTFRLAWDANSIRITRAEGFDQEAGDAYLSRTLSLQNDKGRVIEEFSPALDYEMNMFDELFNLARRSAYKTDDVLDSIMKDIRRRLGA